MTELSQGTVTLVFTDIVGSTRLLTSLGSRYEAVLADHRRLLRAAFQFHAGAGCVLASLHRVEPPSTLSRASRLSFAVDRFQGVGPPEPTAKPQKR
ncbi:hypothetical protein BH18ACT16_BH18ACT16_10950 [soil metagenome]